MIQRRAVFSTRHDWVVFGWILSMHLGAIAAFYSFSWQGVWVAVFLWWLCGGVGITLGYHRYFTHKSYATPKVVQYILAVCGCMAGEAGPINWVAAHRYHHSYSDLDEDPHSPKKKGFWWAHVLWLFGREKFLAEYDSYKKFCPDMTQDKVIVFLDRNHMLPVFILTGVLYALGGWHFVIWGIFVRSVMVYHSTWLVNSASHMWGYRSYQTTDDSRNNWWVAALAFGEGWHNNHHAYQRSARHGFRWWEFDLTYLQIRLLKLLGLASEIHLPETRSAVLGMTKST